MWLKRAHDDPQAVLYVARNMREWDKREIFATQLDDDPVNLAELSLAGGPVCWVVGLDQPIAAFGASLMWPGVWTLWLYATDDFGQIGLSVTKFIVRYMLPMLRDAGAHRLEARSMEGHMDAQMWLEVIGATREATLRGYGREGQDFHTYTWPCAGTGEAA